MKSALLFFVASIAMHSVVLAQSTPNDPRAEKLLKSLEQKLDSYDIFKADFVYELQNQAAGINETQEGTIIVDKKGHFKLSLSEQIIYCNLKSLTVWMPQMQEVQISEYNKQEFEFAPSEMFKLYEKGFLYAMAEPRTIEGKTYQQVHLTPQDKDKPYFKIKVLIDKKAMQPYQTELRYKNGNVYTYTVKDFIPDPGGITDDFYTFSPSDHPQAEIVDLR